MFQSKRQLAGFKPNPSLRNIGAITMQSKPKPKMQAEKKNVYNYAFEQPIIIAPVQSKANTQKLYVAKKYPGPIMGVFNFFCITEMSNYKIQ